MNSIIRSFTQQLAITSPIRGAASTIASTSSSICLNRNQQQPQSSLTAQNITTNVRNYKLHTCNIYIYEDE